MIKATKRLSIGQIAEEFDLKIIGENHNQIIEGIATLERAQEGYLSFFTNKKYKADFLQSKASVVIISEEFISDCPCTALVAANPYLSYAKIADFLTQSDSLVRSIHASAIIHPSVKIPESCYIDAHVVIAEDVVIGENTRIEAGCVIKSGSCIGDNCHLYPNVTIYHGVSLGNHVLVHAGTVIGSDGFGIANDRGEWVKVPQLGGVQIGNYVELGACCTIDRGALDDTIIYDGVKLDNQVHIAHNNIIGENTAIAAQAGIAGSTQIGKNCAFGGQVGIVGHAHIADNVQVLGGAKVMHSLTESGSYSSGTPVQEASLWHKNHVRFKQLDNMYRQLKRINKALDSE